MIKIIEPINIKPILEEYKTIEKDIYWTEFGHKGKQSGLQFRENQNPWVDAVDRSKGAEMTFDQINPFFKNTLFEKLIKKYDLKRTRLMWMGNFACYSMHTDLSPRIHIPLITNDQCYFVFEQGLVKNLLLGFVYWIDTTKKHTAINGSDKWRLHLVGCVKE
jgi:hypothetical protein